MVSLRRGKVAHPPAATLALHHAERGGLLLDLGAPERDGGMAELGRHEVEELEVGLAQYPAVEARKRRRRARVRLGIRRLDSA